jgi:hypothetical protein
MKFKMAATAGISLTPSLFTEVSVSNVKDIDFASVSPIFS